MVTHYFNTEEILDYIGAMPDIPYYGVDEMIGGRGSISSHGRRHTRLTYSITGFN